MYFNLVLVNNANKGGPCEPLPSTGPLVMISVSIASTWT